jgi:hypothetical protein
LFTRARTDRIPWVPVRSASCVGVDIKSTVMAYKTSGDFQLGLVRSDIDIGFDAYTSLKGAIDSGDEQVCRPTRCNVQGTCGVRLPKPIPHGMFSLTLEIVEHSLMQTDTAQHPANVVERHAHRHARHTDGAIFFHLRDSSTR